MEKIKSLKINVNKTSTVSTLNVENRRTNEWSFYTNGVLNSRRLNNNNGYIIEYNDINGTLERTIRFDQRDRPYEFYDEINKKIYRSIEYNGEYSNLIKHETLSENTLFPNLPDRKDQAIEVFYEYDDDDNCIKMIVNGLDFDNYKRVVISKYNDNGNLISEVISDEYNKDNESELYELLITTKEWDNEDNLLSETRINQIDEIREEVEYKKDISTNTLTTIIKKYLRGNLQSEKVMIDNIDNMSSYKAFTYEYINGVKTLISEKIITETYVDNRDHLKSVINITHNPETGEITSNSTNYKSDNIELEGGYMHVDYMCRDKGAVFKSYRYNPKYESWLRYSDRYLMEIDKNNLDNKVITEINDGDMHYTLTNYIHLELE